MFTDYADNPGFKVLNALYVFSAYPWLPRVGIATELGDGKTGYQCNVCGVKFAHQSWMKRHIRKHTGEKPFACDVCGRGFTRREVMFSHKLTHQWNS